MPTPTQNLSSQSKMPTTPPPPSPLPTTKETRRHLYCLLITSLISLLFPLSFFSSSTTPLSRHYQKLILQTNPFLTPHSPSPPSIAYFLSASDGDSHRLIRLLFSIYHPRNQYLLHLDLTAPQSQRDQLALSVQSLPLFRRMKNVNVIGKADFAYPRGSSPISSTLHGAAILLNFSRNWDWFINLDASDYPLVSRHSRWSRKLKRITVDPGLYLSDKTEMFYATQKRELPNMYRLFTGSQIPRHLISDAHDWINEIPLSLYTMQRTRIQQHKGDFIEYKKGLSEQGAHLAKRNT